jgi:hypothetical protein
LKAVPDDIARVDPRIVTQGEPATYFAHEPSGRWVAAARGFLEVDDKTFVDWQLEELISTYSDLLGLADLPTGWHAYRKTAEEPWTRLPMPQGRMHLLSYELRPSAEHTEREEIGGAFVNCWVKSESLNDATQVSEKHLSESGWTILHMEGPPRTVELASIPAESARYFRQAEIDGEVFVIHAFPPEPPDA